MRRKIIQMRKGKKKDNSLNKVLEDQINECTQQLNDSKKELESFAYAVSHDLRAPLRHVIGYSEILSSFLKDSGNNEVDRLTGKIIKSALRMNRLIDELLAYSLLERTELKLIDISMQEVVNKIVHDATDLLQNRKVEWKIGTLPVVKADKTQIHLVIKNLINNAIKFTSRKEHCIIEIYCEEPCIDKYTFCIKDNGAGFNMEYAGKLFGVFQRLHTAEEFEGTGIGLATVRRIISRHNGAVWAEGIENEGAIFFFTLPKKYTAAKR